VGEGLFRIFYESNRLGAPVKLSAFAPRTVAKPGLTLKGLSGTEEGF
jgi:hypothetical protein